MDQQPDDRGSVTAETAVVLPTLVLVAVLGVWAVGAAAAQVRCIDAAASGARALARGEPPALVVEAVREIAPAGAQVVLGGDAGIVRVEVSAEVSLPWGPLSKLPALDVGAGASAAREGTS